jgi:hypothetical protein
MVDACREETDEHAAEKTEATVEVWVITLCGGVIVLGAGQLELPSDIVTIEDSPNIVFRLVVELTVYVVKLIPSA